jgi:hypothetical protein
MGMVRLVRSTAVRGRNIVQVCYFAPDALRWESLDIGHGEFVHAMIGGAVTQFYAGMRWPGREADCDALGLGEGFALWPPPFSVEGRDLALVSRRTVPIAELFAFCNDTARQLDGLRLTALTPQRLQRPAPPIRCGLASPIASHHIRPCPNG